MVENELRHPMGVLHLLSIKNIFYDKIDFFLFSCDEIVLGIFAKFGRMYGN